MPSKGAGNFLSPHRTPTLPPKSHLLDWHSKSFQPGPGSFPWDCRPQGLFPASPTLLRALEIPTRWGVWWGLFKSRGRKIGIPDSTKDPNRIQVFFFFHSPRDLGNYKHLYKYIFHYITIFCLHLQTPTLTRFAMNPTENNTVYSFHHVTVCLAPCHTFKMYPEWNNICVLLVVPGKKGSTWLPRLREAPFG